MMVQMTAWLPNLFKSQNIYPKQVTVKYRNNLTGTHFSDILQSRVPIQQNTQGDRPTLSEDP